MLRGSAVVGSTPCEVEVTSADRHLQLRLDGYRSQSVVLPLVENPWVVGNLVTLGLGMVVDEATGAHRVPCTAPLFLRLRPGTGTEDRVVVPARSSPRTSDSRATRGGGASEVIRGLLELALYLSR